MTGRAYWAIFKFYDILSNKMAFKKRPVLIIGKADARDYIVLPISRVTRKEFLHPRYDFEIKAKDFPKLSLKDTSYVRTHKQTVLNKGELQNCIVDFKEEYEDAYIEIMTLVVEFQKNLISKSL